MSHNPTKKQIEFAEQLEVDVPEGVTKAGLSGLLTGAKEARRWEESGHPALSNELARFVRHTRTPSHLVAMINTFREKGIREGGVVRLPNQKLGVVLGAHAKDVLTFSVLIIPERHLKPVHGLKLVHIYTPPQTHTHELRALPLPAGKSWFEHKEKMLAFAAFASPRISSEHRFRNEHGEFWARSAIEHLVAEQAEVLATEERRKEDAHVKKRASQPKTRHFCCVCGVDTEFDEQNRVRCAGCRGKPIPAERFCKKCGVKFTLAANVIGGAGMMCQPHRRTTS